MGQKTGVWENKTKQMENEKWIDDGQRTGDAEHRSNKDPSSAEVVTTTLFTKRVFINISCLFTTTNHIASAYIVRPEHEILIMAMYTDLPDPDNMTSQEATLPSAGEESDLDLQLCRHRFSHSFLLTLLLMTVKV